MKFRLKRGFWAALLVVSVLIIVAFVPVFATSVTVLDGKLSVTDTANKLTGTETLTAETASGGVISKKTNTITIVNKSADVATVSFTYSASNHNSLTIAGSAAPSSSGDYSLLMSPEDSLVLVLESKSGWSVGAASLTLSDFSFVVAAAESTVTLGTYNTSLGTATVGGGTSATGNIENGVALVATANSGVTFLGWVNAADGKILSTSASYTLTPSADMTVTAAFASASTNAWFLVDNTKMFDDLGAAASAATSTIVLLSDGTLPGNQTYSIPSGITLLIPYDANHSTSVDYVEDINSNSAGSAFRTLTVPSTTTININGTLMVNAKCCIKPGGRYSGSVYGGYGKMVLDGTLNINDGGVFYARGYIVASDHTSHTADSALGRVNVASGGSVYMPLQLTDWRGGDSVSSIKDAVFPINSYYFNNIMVHTTYAHGAKLYASAAIQVSYVGKIERDVALISTDSSALFQISSRNVYTDYQYDGDRMIISTDGEITVNKVEVALSLGLLGDYSMTTEGKQLPLAGQMTLIMKDGSKATCSSDIKMLPGSQVIVEDGAEFNMSGNLYMYSDTDYLASYRRESSQGRRRLNVSGIIQSAGGLVKDGSAYVFVEGTVNVTGEAKVWQSASYATEGGRYNGGIVALHGGTINFATISAADATTGINEVEGTAESVTPFDKWKPVTGILAGLSTSSTNYVSFSGPGAGAYYAYGNSWYQYTVSVADGTVVTPANGYPTIADTTDGDSIVGYIVKGGVFSFTTSNACGVSATKANITKNSDGSYTLTGDADGGEVVITVSAHNYGANSVCSCGWFKFHAANVRLGNNLDMMFAFPAESLLKLDKAVLEKCVVKIERTYATGETKTTTIPISEWYSLDENYFVVIYKGFAAKEMCDTVTLTVCDGDGNALSASCEDSIQKYAMRMLEKYSNHANLSRLIVDMLYYGAACQTHFKYGEVLATNELSDAQKALATTGVSVSDETCAESRTNDTYWAGANLIAESNIQFAVAFKGLSDDAVITYTFKNHRTGDSESGTVSYANLIRSTGENGEEYLYFVIPELVVADARQVISIVVTSNGKTEEWQESVEAYIARNQATSDVFLAFMKFADSAKTYLHNGVVS